MSNVECQPYKSKDIKLKYIGKFYSGLVGKSGEDFPKESKIGYSPYVSFTNILKNFEINYNSLNFVKVNEKQNKVKKDDLLFLMTSENYENLGKSAIVIRDITDLYLNSLCKGYRLSDENVFPRYLGYLLNSHAIRSKISINGKGSTRINLNVKILLNLKVQLPLCVVQKKISNYLDKKLGLLSETIELNNKIIDKLDRAKQSLINETLMKLKDVETKKFKYLFNISSGYPLSRDMIVEEGISYLHYRDIHTKYLYNLDLNKNELPKVSEEYINKKKSAILKEGNFIFCDISEDVEGSGNFTYIENMGGEIVLSGLHTLVAKARKDICCKYFSYYFRSECFKDLIAINIYGVKVLSLTQKSLSSIKISYPDIETQEKIAELLDRKCKSINDQISLRKRVIEKMELSKKSLIYEAVTGKINI